jgi:hypothetical protein
MGPKMLARQWMQATDTKTEAGPHAAAMVAENGVMS